MINQNLKEYEILRQEMESIRNRLTTHMSFSIGGSGILFLAIQSIEFREQTNLTISIICIFTALIIASFFYLSLYKYNSLNRYCGYCKLINLEVFTGQCQITPNVKDDSKRPDTFITWEYCIAKLANTKIRESFNSKYYEEKLKFDVIGKSKEETIKILEEKFYKYRIYEPEVDKNSILKGILTLLKAINNKDKSESWKYPLYSCYIYYTLIFFFVAVGLLNLSRYVSITLKNNLDFPLYSVFEISLIAVLMVIIIKVVFHSFGDIYKLMKGSKTVSAYCWKFLPYRIAILNEFNVKPRYFFTEKK